MSKGFGTQINADEAFSNWFLQQYRRASTTSLSDSLLGDSTEPIDLRVKMAREMPGCYWLAQVWPKAPNKKTILNVFQRGRLHSLFDLNELILRGPDGDDIRRWARDHADPAYDCACC